MRRVLVLRPEPGATATLRRARERGLEAEAVPLFEVEPVEWSVPDPSDFDALLLTSANAVRHGGPGLQALRELPVHAVGEATARAAREAGFAVATIGAWMLKCTSTSAPSASLSTTLDRIRRPGGASGTSDASSMSSGRIPRITSLPSYPARSGRAAITSSGSSSRCPPNSRVPEPLDLDIVACTMFIAGEPMNPATNRFTGRSYNTWGGSTCCSTPLRITATRSPIVIAST